MKRYKSLLCALFTLIAVLAATAAPIMALSAGAEGENLTIRGDGVENEISFSREELEGLTDIIERHTYSVINNFPTARLDYASGIPLPYLLEQAGLKDTARLITFIASDGYRRTFTIEELLLAERYFFPEAGGRGTPVPAMISLQGSRTGFNDLEGDQLRLVMGQRAPNEQNNPWFVRFMQTIEVSTEAPGKWPEVGFTRVAGPEGVTLHLTHQNFDSVKIYYTTDGSVPTVESNMYNISATYFQPHLIVPLLIDKTTVVRAVAIGAGGEDSAVSSITISFDDAAEAEPEASGSDWTKPAIYQLFRFITTLFRII